MTPSYPALGIVYTETLVHLAPEQFASEAPYQVAIIETPEHGRLTVRIAPYSEGDPVQVGDPVRFLEVRNGVPFYRKDDSSAA